MYTEYSVFNIGIKKNSSSHERALFLTIFKNTGYLTIFCYSVEKNN